MTEDLEKYYIRDATHDILCRHQYCRNSVKSYRMPCIILSETKSGKYKVVVFGDRMYQDNRFKKIRYVEKDKIIEKRNLDELFKINTN